MQNLDTYNSIDTLDIERQIEFLATFRAQGIITVENLFDEGEVQAFDDLWNGIAQRRAAANLLPAPTLMKAHTAY